MKLNKLFAKSELKQDGTPDYAPAVMDVVTHHHEEWDEPVIDPETGEPTGETEHKTRDWDTWEQKIWPIASDYRKMNYLPVVNVFPKDPAPEGYHYEGKGWIVDDAVRYVYELVQNPPASPRTFDTADLVEALMEENVWEQARAWIVKQGILDLVLATKEFTEDNKNFTAGRNALQETLGWTDEDVEEFLQKCAKTRL